jgi:hypothetical protein
MSARLFSRSATAAAVTVVAVLAASASPASAAAPLASGIAILTSQVSATYGPQTTRPYWSVVATVGHLGGQSDLTVYGPNDALVGASAAGFGIVDWVAIDNNSGRLPVGAYTVDVSAATDGGRPTTHLVQFVSGGAMLTPGQPETAIGYANGPWLVDVRDVYLGAGQTMNLKVRGLDNLTAVHVLRSTDSPASWAPTRSDTASSVDLPKEDVAGQAHHVTYTAPTGGYYGVVFESRQWGQWVGTQSGGLGFASVTVS